MVNATEFGKRVLAHLRRIAPMGGKASKGTVTPARIAANRRNWKKAQLAQKRAYAERLRARRNGS